MVKADQHWQKRLADRSWRHGVDPEDTIASIWISGHTSHHQASKLTQTARLSLFISSSLSCSLPLSLSLSLSEEEAEDEQGRTRKHTRQAGKQRNRERISMFFVFVNDPQIKGV